MNKKYLLRFGCALGSSLMLGQMAPLVQAQPNMSDATGGVVTTGNGAGNMSDATGVNIISNLLIKLTTTNLVTLTGVAVPADIQLALLELLTKGNGDISASVNILVRAGIPNNLAVELAKSLQGLIQANGTINQAQLVQVIVSYRAILEGASVQFLLNPPIEFLALQAILSQLGNATDFAFISTGTSTNVTFLNVIKSLTTSSFVTVNGLAIPAELQVTLLNLLLGRSVSISSTVTLLVQAGIPSNLAQALAQSFQGLILADGSVNQTQLVVVVNAFRAIVANADVNFLSNPPIAFLAIQALLSQFGNAGDFAFYSPPSNGGGGNMSDGTGGVITDGDVAGNLDDGNDKDDGQSAGNLSDSTGAVVTTGDIAGNLSDSTGAVVTTSDIAGNLEDDSTENVPLSNSASPTSDGGQVKGTSVIFIASYIGGPFKFANSKIQAAIRRGAKRIINELKAEGSLTVGSATISGEAKQVVLNLIIAKNDSGNGRFVSSCTRAGISGNLAQNLAKSLQGIIIVNDAGEVTEVDATKFLAALGSYNAVIDTSSVEVLINRPAEVQVVQFALSQMVDAALSATPDNQAAASEEVTN